MRYENVFGTKAGKTRCKYGMLFDKTGHNGSHKIAALQITYI